MALLTPQTVPDTGVARTYVSAAGGGDTVLLDPSLKSVLTVKTVGTGITVTIVTPRLDAFGNNPADKAIAIGTNVDMDILLPYDEFADPSTGLCSITYSAVTSVTVGVSRA